MAAQRPGVAAESYRRSIGKWLAGETVTNGSAALLGEILGQPATHFASPKVTPAEFMAMVQQIAADVARLQERLDALEQHQDPDA